MQTAGDNTAISVEQYLADELARDIKHELIDGRVYAMGGASMNHVRICGNIFAAFRAHLKGSSCQVAMNDMKVKVGSSFFYPDVLVDCDFDENTPYVSDNPVIIVEVLSKSTRRTDQTTKRLRYINLPGLKEYVLIEQDIVDIEVMRKSDAWRSKRYFMGDQIHFESIDLTLSV